MFLFWFQIFAATFGLVGAACVAVVKISMATPIAHILEAIKCKLKALTAILEEKGCYIFYYSAFIVLEIVVVSYVAIGRFVH